MNDRNYLRNLAAKLESTPSLTMDGGASAKRLRAIADAIGEDQDTSTQEFTQDGVWEVRTVVTNGLPQGVFVFTTPPTSPDGPHTIVGSIRDNKVYGLIERAHYMHVSTPDSSPLMNKIAEMYHARSLAPID